MYENEEASMKRTEFRKQIRRRQIQQIFSAQRIKFAQDMIRDELEETMKELDTPEKKRQWLIGKVTELGKTPTKAWYGTFRKLSIGIQAFKQKGDFGDWIELGIIKSLTDTLKQQNLQMELSRIAACILQDIFFYLPAECEQVHQILQYQFIIDIVELCAKESQPAEYYYDLVSSMIHDRNYLRNLFIDNGLVQALTLRLKGYLNKDLNTDEVYCALSLAFRLVKSYGIPGGSVLAKGNINSIFIPIFDTYLTALKRDDSITIVLKSFASLAMTQKEYILAQLYTSPNLMPYLMHSLCIEGSPTNRTMSSSILAAILSSQKISYSEQLVAQGLLDKILSCSRMQNNHENCLASLLQMVSNIVGNCLDDARKVLRHEVFAQLVLPYANQTQNPKLNQTAIFIISTLVMYQNFQTTELLLRKYSILECLIQGLSVPIPCSATCMEILKCLCNLVAMYNSIYTGAQNKVTLDLERMYNIDSVLTALEERLKNKKVQTLIQILIDSMNGQ